MSWVNIGTSIVMWGIVLMSSTLTYRHGARILEPVVGVIIPTYKTFKALKMNDAVVEAQKRSTWLIKKDVPVPNASQKLSTWSTYWIVYCGCFGVGKFFVDRIAGWWFQMYHEIKLVLLIALQYPIPFLTNEPGSAIVYRNLIKPFMEKNEKYIDMTVGKCKQQLHLIQLLALI